MNLVNRAVAYTAGRPQLIPATLGGFAALFAGYGWYDLHVGNVGGAQLAAICSGLALTAAVGDAVRLLRKRITAGQAVAIDFSGLPKSLRDLAEFVDASARRALADGHLHGADAAVAGLDAIADTVVQDAACRRMLELAFERETAGQVP